MSMKKIVSAAFALLTAVSSISICSFSASAAQISDSELSADDIAFLHSKGYSDEFINDMLQKQASRSSTQVYSYACFAYSNVNYDNEYVEFEIYRPNDDVSYYDYVTTPALTNSSIHCIGTQIYLSSYYDCYDRFKGYIQDDTYLGAFRYTSANTYLWTSPYYYVINSLHYNNNVQLFAPVLMGDINQDGYITVGDWVWLLRIQDNQEITGLTNAGRRAADINCNGNPADNDDGSRLAQYVNETRDNLFT